MYICRSVVKSNRLVLPTSHHRCRTAAQLYNGLQSEPEKGLLESLAAQWTREHPKYVYVVVEDNHNLSN